jgi:uncharacterized protein DUF4388
MQPESTIDQISLSELLSRMISSSVTGVLEVGDHPCIGQVFCRDGWVYHAASGDKVSVAALRRILEAQNARVRFIPGVTCETETLWRDPKVLIDFTKRQEELQARVRPYISSMTWVPLLHARTDDTRVQLSRDDWQVLAAVDGRRSVTEIAELLWQEPLEVALAISALVERGLVHVRPPEAPYTTFMPAGGFLERLLANLAPAYDVIPTSLARPPASGGSFAEWLLTGRAGGKPAAQRIYF